MNKSNRTDVDTQGNHNSIQLIALVSPKVIVVALAPFVAMMNEGRYV